MSENKSKVMRLSVGEKRVIETLRGMNVEELVSELLLICNRSNDQKNVIKLIRALNTFNQKPIQDLQTLLNEGFMSRTQMDELITAIMNNKNIIIYGLTGSGKTTLMNAILMYIGLNRLADKMVLHDQQRESSEAIRDFEIPHIHQVGVDLTMNDLTFLFDFSTKNKLVIDELRHPSAFIGAELALSKECTILSTMHATSIQNLKDRITIKGSSLFDNHPFTCIQVDYQNGSRFVKDISHVG